jgi:hypothetical protein
MKKLMLIIAAAIFLAPQVNWSQGCIEPSSDEGVQVIGFLQPEFRYDFLGDDKITGENLEDASFYFNRLRLGVTGNIPYDFSYYAIAELSPRLDGPYILDAYVSYNRFGPWAKISMGQFKTPFGLELSTPCHKLNTINRSRAIDNLVATSLGRDFGIMISGGTDSLSIFGSKTKNLFGYSFAVMNGNGMNLTDNNRAKDLVGRVTFHPLEFVTVGASYRFGKHPALSPTADKQDERERLGLDLELKYKGFLIQGEYVKGADVGSYTIGGGCSGEPEQTIEGSVDREGYFVQAMYMTPWRIQPVIKYEYYEPNMAADILHDQINTITYGINIFPNEWTRLQINYLYNVEEDGTVEYKNDALLIQAQISF